MPLSWAHCMLFNVASLAVLPFTLLFLLIQNTLPLRMQPTYSHGHKEMLPTLIRSTKKSSHYSSIVLSFLPKH